MKEDDKNGEILLRARFGSGVCHPCPTLATQTPTFVLLPTGQAPAPQPATSSPHHLTTLVHSTHRIQALDHTNNRHPPPSSYPPGVGSSRPLCHNPEVVISTPPHYSSTQYKPRPCFGSYKQQKFTSGRWRMQVTVLVEFQANEIIE